MMYPLREQHSYRRRSTNVTLHSATNPEPLPQNVTRVVLRCLHHFIIRYNKRRVRLSRRSLLQAEASGQRK
eukprot:scaffold13280_cov100-Skeletonema_marinoi.AAC.1